MSMVDHKWLHDATLMKVNVSDMHFILKSQPCVTHTTTVNCFQKCGFNWYETNDSKNVTELSIPEDEWSQLKAGPSFQEYVSSANNVVTCELQTLQQMMDEMSTSELYEKELGRGRW
jgi:hypothetical protein